MNNHRSREFPSNLDSDVLAVSGVSVNTRMLVCIRRVLCDKERKFRAAKLNAVLEYML